MENPFKMDDLGVPLFSETSSSSAFQPRFHEPSFRDWSDFAKCLDEKTQGWRDFFESEAYLEDHSSSLNGQ